MATIADISQVLGDYMLRGWVLTDQSCPTAGCAVPLLRSPTGRTPVTTFCVKCSGGEPQAAQPQPDLPAASSNASSESQPNSRSSTPPTDFSEAPSSPIFVPLAETEETRRRRQQSDQASSEIGKRLLRGWAMLGDECPNDTCFGVPLVRPPKAGGEKDPRKECVICGHTYITEIDWAGRENLVPFVSKVNTHGTSTDPQASGSQRQTITSPATQSNLPFSSPFGRHIPDEKIHESGSLARSSEQPTARQNPAPNAVSSVSAITATADAITLEETSRALYASLNVLSGRLTSISSNPAMDPASLGVTADAIQRVTQALGQVRSLQQEQN